MMLSAVLLSMMILLCTLYVIRYLIWQQLELVSELSLTYKTIDQENSTSVVVAVHPCMDPNLRKCYLSSNGILTNTL